MPISPGRRVAEVALAGDAETGRELAAERLAHDLLGVAVPTAGREILQVDPGGVHGGDAFVGRGRSLQHAGAAATAGERGDGRKVAELVLLHYRSPSAARLNGQICRRP